MRKNGVNREIRRMEGSLSEMTGVRVCLPALQDSAEEALTLVAVEERAPLAVYLSDRCFFKEKVPLDGNARAVCLLLRASAVATRSAEKAECALKEGLAESLHCEVSDILLFPVGEVNGSFPVEGLLKNGIRLTEKLNTEERKGLTCLAGDNALTSSRNTSFTYSFDLGDFPCLLSGVGACGKRVSDGASPLLLTMATDVRITPNLLTRALVSAYKDTFGMLGREATPFDVATLFSTQKAENALIDREDGEYKKFVFSLKKVFEEIAKSLAVGEGECLTEICVLGGRSKQAVRIAAKNLALRFATKKRGWRSLLTEIYSSIGKDVSVGSFSCASVRIRSQKGELVLLEDGVAFSCNEGRMKEILSSEELCVALDFHEGNFSARSWVRIGVRAEIDK